MIPDVYRNGFKGARKLPASAVEMNCPFAIILSLRLNMVNMLSYQPYSILDNK
jgi:hypothetical protein